MNFWRSTGMVAGGIGIVGTSFFLTLQFIDFYAEKPDVVVLQTRADTHDAGWPDFTMRVVIPRNAFAAFGRGVKIQFGAGSTKGLSIKKAFIGNPSQTGQPYAFASQPRPITFRGNSAVLIAKSGRILSDEVADFEISKDRDLLVTFHIDSKENDDPIAKVPTPGWQAYYKAKDDAGTVAASDYSDRSSAFVSHGISEIRVTTLQP